MSLQELYEKSVLDATPITNNERLAVARNLVGYGRYNDAKMLLQTISDSDMAEAEYLLAVISELEKNEDDAHRHLEVATKAPVYRVLNYTYLRKEIIESEAKTLSSELRSEGMYLLASLFACYQKTETLTDEKKEELIDTLAKDVRISCHDLTFNVEDDLLYKRDLLFLTGEVDKLAQIEKLLFSITPWNYREIKKLAQNIEVSGLNIYFPQGCNLSRISEVSSRFVSRFLKSSAEAGHKGAIEMYAYYMAHKHGMLGYTLFSEKMSDELICFLEEHSSDLTARTLFLLLLNKPISEVLTPSAVKQYSPLCPEVNDMYDMGIVMGLVNLEDNIKDANIPRKEAYLRLAARAESSSFAKFCLGYCYDKGLLVEKNKSQAEQWFKWSAAEGCCCAQIMLHRKGIAIL